MSLIVRCLSVALFCLSLASAARADESYLHTREVRALAAHGGNIWVATSGGLERYRADSLERMEHLTMAHGLDSVDVLALELAGGELHARTAGSRCKLMEGHASCVATQAPLPSPQLHARDFQGSRVSALLPVAQGTLIGTRGDGLWLENSQGKRRLTPARQVCTNHVQALSSFRGELWLGAFRDGLCVQRAGGFERIPTPFRFVNALLTVDDVLYVAANEGLFRTADGSSFERVAKVPERGVNGLARSGHTLLVTTPATLYRIPLQKGRVETLRQPGGSTAVQGVSVHGGDVWLASEDRGALRVRNRQVTPFDALAGLGSSWVVDVTVDARGTAYAATLKDGLFAISPRGTVQKLSSPSPWLLRLSWVRDTLWVGSQDGLWDVAQHRAAEPIVKLSGACVHAVLEHERMLWVATESGLHALPQATPAPALELAGLSP